MTTIDSKRTVKDVISRNIRDFATFGALILLGVIITMIRPVFISPANLMNVITQASVNAIIAIGMTFVILSGGIDLSVGSVLAFTGAVMASIAKLSESGAIDPNVAIILGIVGGVAIGVAAGVTNGSFVVFGEMHPFIATLGMMSIARGLALVWTGGRAIYGFGPLFRWFGAGYIGPFPTQVVLCIGLYVLSWWSLKYTKLGRYAYAIGGNEESARLSGINVAKMKIVFFAINGLTAAIGALVLTARLDSARPIAGTGFELQAIAAVTIGGTSQRGGEGKIFGSLVGALIISVLRNGLNLMAVSAYVQQIAIGLVIILAVLLDTKTKRK